MAARGVLLDIEGTTSSIRFVYEEMFPFVRREIEPFLRESWRQTSVQEACQRIADDAGYASLGAWCGETASDEACRKLVVGEVLQLMDSDAKSTGLKQLQGLIWRSGFETGELRAHLFDDVRPALAAWRGRGLEIRIYSSGSIVAQKLFFGHTVAGNLLPMIGAYYDTTTGSKRESASYTTIAVDWGISPASIVFLSDIPPELDAARRAGMQTVLVSRPGNPAVSTDVDHPHISSFAELHIATDQYDASTR